MVVLFDVFWMVSIVLLLSGADAILENGYRLQGQRYVALLSDSEMLAWFHFKGLMFAMQLIRLIKLDIY